MLIYTVNTQASHIQECQVVKRLLKCIKSVGMDEVFYMKLTFKKIVFIFFAICL